MFSFTVTPVYSDPGQLREETQVAVYHDADSELKMESHDRRES